jgi:hypothetical protein
MLFQIVLQMRPGPIVRVEVEATNKTEAILRGAARAELLYRRTVLRVIACRRVVI